MRPRPRTTRTNLPSPSPTAAIRGADCPGVDLPGGTSVLLAAEGTATHAGARQSRPLSHAGLTPGRRGLLGPKLPKTVLGARGVNSWISMAEPRMARLLGLSWRQFLAYSGPPETLYTLVGLAARWAPRPPPVELPPVTCLMNRTRGVFRAGGVSDAASAFSTVRGLT